MRDNIKLNINASASDEVEFCPRCQADLTLQKGFDNTLPYWVCRGCGEMLVNPDVDFESGIAWICDECSAMLNIQPGFDEDCGEWTCTECGHINKINAKEVYAYEDEYQSDKCNPYKGLSDEDLLELSTYVEVDQIEDMGNVIPVKSVETGEIFIKKILYFYDKAIYQALIDAPAAHMPRIIGMYEGENTLIVIEEYIEGKTVEALIEDNLIDRKMAATIAKKVCGVLTELHDRPTPIIHRDIKPSNVMVDFNGEVWLIDINVSKLFHPEDHEGIRYTGTLNYAAPEQIGFGIAASTPGTDIYAVGVLLNVMLTGHLPQERKAEQPLWDIIKKCISLEVDDRYTASELIDELERIGDI